MTFRLRILLFLAELDSITHLDPSIVIPVLLKPDILFKDKDFSVLPIFRFPNAIAYRTAHYGVRRLYGKVWSFELVSLCSTVPSGAYLMPSACIYEINQKLRLTRALGAGSRRD